MGEYETGRGAHEVIVRRVAPQATFASHEAPSAPDEGDSQLGDVRVLAHDGSKTPGELALLVGGHTLTTGDLVRVHEGGKLTLLPEEKLADPEAAKGAIARFADLPQVEAVLVGDGWPVFPPGHERLGELLA